MTFLENPYYAVKRQLKNVRWKMRRRAVARQYGAEMLAAMPVVLGNAIPKAGSHLLIQILLGLTKIGPFVDPGFPPVNRGEANEKLSKSQIVENIQQMQGGDIGYSYLACKPPFDTLLIQPGIATVFVYRDPRDVVLSEIKYATDIQTKHDLHVYFNETLTSDEERLNFAIKGSSLPGLSYTGVRKRFRGYGGWLKTSVLSLRFEDLVQRKQVAYDHILDYLAEFGFELTMPRQEAVEILIDGIAPKKSGTFRKGKPGGWKEAFSKENKALFKQEAGDILIELGYEKDMDW